MELPDDDPRAEGGDESITVRIDHDLCSGTAHCQLSMPEVFVVTGRKSRVRSDVVWSRVDHDDLRGTADACPWFAIEVSPTPGA